MESSGIYSITNIKNGKKYIGSAKNFKIRWNRHINHLKKNKHCNVYLQRIYNKYGLDIFKFEIIEKCEYNKDIILEKENYYIEYFDSKNSKMGYNLSDASFGDYLSNHPNKEQIIKKRSKTFHDKYDSLSKEERSKKWGLIKEKNGMFGKTHTDDVKKKISNVHKGNKYRLNCKASEETREKLSFIASQRIGDKNPFYGKKHSEETKKKLSEKRIGIKPSNMRKVIIDDIEYESLKEASKQTGINNTTILWRINSKNIKYKNYRYN